MRPRQVEITDLSQLDPIIEFDCRVRRWLDGVPLSTIVVLVDAIVDEMEARVRPRCRGVARGSAIPRRPSGLSMSSWPRFARTDAPEDLRRTAEPSERHLPE